MKISLSIQSKAAFLTFVFLLNTLVGFACAVGMDVGFNARHHDHAKYSHHKSTETKHTSKSQKDNCCKEQVTKLSKADKLTQPRYNYSLLSSLFFLLPSTVYRIGETVTFPVNVPNNYFVRHCRAPIPDIRIAIQSFQI
jgi:hypothetical protein